ncbi:ABC transporter substrate-binding protein [Terrarubrum flagellatum]|uniref:ABC transporter substrate-binding protein n=1 Tax=Terrirubrum flagellatum TaxID=2895980 RepID=UPI00314554EA
MNLNRTRRQILKVTALAALAAPALVRAQTAQRIRYAGFVQSEGELKQLLAALNRYKAINPGVDIVPEFTNFSSFIDKLATETSGGNAPDMFSCNVDIVDEYARRGVLRPLTSYTPNPIDLSDYVQGAVKAATVNGQLFAFPNDAIGPALVCRADSFKKAGVAQPNQMWTWEQLAKISVDLTKANGPRFWGMEDSGSNYIPCDLFMRGMGKTLFTPDRKIGFQSADLAEWFAYWDRLRKSGGVPPADIQASVNGSDITTFLVTHGRAAMTAALTDKFAGIQTMVTNSELFLQMLPNGFDGGTMKQNHYVYAGNSTGLSAKSPHVDRMVDVVRYLHRDHEGVKLRYLGSGMIPCSKATRDMLVATGNPVDAKIVAYIGLLQQQEAAPRSPGVVGMSNMLRRMNEAVAFGRLKPQDAAAQFIEEAEKRLKA